MDAHTAPEKPKPRKRTPATDDPTWARRMDRDVRLRLNLIRALAEGAKSQVQLAREYDCNQATISRFKTRYAEKIEAVKKDLGNEFAGLWVSDKKQRVAAYQTEVEHLEKAIRALEPDDALPGDLPPTTELVALYKRRDNALRAVAEELGQLPTRLVVQSNGRAARLELSGVDVDKV